jgi:hypothetical protein
MEQHKPDIYVARPQETVTLNKAEIEAYQQQYHLTQDEIEQAFSAVGNDKIKLKNFLEAKGSQPTSRHPEHSIPETAINPNPGANGNIEPVIENLGDATIESQKEAPNNEITDGEDG